MNIQVIVMPAWMAGIQIRKDASEKTSMLTWIPALHAGTTQSRVLFKLIEAPSDPYFKRA
jgi:hypothetical protein